MNIAITGLSYTYNLGSPNAFRALQGISLHVPAGENLGLLGATGSGKSTLVQHLNGLLIPQTGTISFDKVEITKGKTLPRQIRQKIGLVFQFAEFGFFEETVFDEVAFSPRQWGWAEDLTRERTLQVLAQMGFPTELARARSPFQLSGGQQRMVALASVLVMQPEVLILDEPTAGLDATARARIRETIQSVKASDHTIIVISHDMDFVASLVDRVVILGNGRIAGDGPASEILSDRALLSRAGLEPPAIIRLRERLLQLGIPNMPASFDTFEVREMLRNRGRRSY